MPAVRLPGLRRAPGEPLTTSRRRPGRPRARAGRVAGRGPGRRAGHADPRRVPGGGAATRCAQAAADGRDPALACAAGRSCSARPACSTAGGAPRTGRTSTSCAERLPARRRRPRRAVRRRRQPGHQRRHRRRHRRLRCTWCAASSARGRPTPIARRMVVPPQRDGGQRQYIEQPIPTCDGRRPAPAARVDAGEPATSSTPSPTWPGGPRCPSAPSPAGSSPRPAPRRTAGSPTQRVLLAPRLLEDTDLGGRRDRRALRLRLGRAAAPPLPQGRRRRAGRLPPHVPRGPVPGARRGDGLIARVSTSPDRRGQDRRDDPDGEETV